MNVIVSRAAPRARRLFAAAAAASLAVAVPATFGGPGLDLNTAYAGKGNGKDNGRGGGNQGRGNANGHAKSDHRNGPSGNDMDGTKPKLPGSLNAAHASPRALSRANANSRVGALGAYMDAMRDYVDALSRGDLAGQEAALDAAAAALADAANKDHLIDPTVVDTVNGMLDGKKPGFSHTPVAGDPVHDAEAEIANRINPPPAP